MGIDEEIAASLWAYKAHFSGEKNSFAVLDGQIERGENLIDRKNMTGHVTASGLVVSPAGEVLLVFHNASDRYQQPGGHIDASDSSLAEAAAREVCEETGLEDITLHNWHAGRPFPINIETQSILPRPEKGEGHHLHHDFLYLFTATSTRTVMQVEEVNDAIWVKSDDPMITLSQIVQAIKKARAQGGLAQ